MTRRWFKIGGGAAAGVTTILALFLFLVTQYSFEITGTDDICAGTYEDPCISFLNVTNPTDDDVDVYNPDMLSLEFSPEIPEYYLFRKDGRCKGGDSCAAPNGVSLTGWNYIDFTNETKPIADKQYVYRFTKKSTKEFLLWGLKNNPSDRVKWSFFVGDDELDPVWEPEATNSLKNLQSSETIFWNKSVNIPILDEECVWHESNQSYTPCEVENIVVVQYNKTKVTKWQEIHTDNQVTNLTDWPYYCWENVTDITCKSLWDGGGYGINSVKPGQRHFVIPLSGSEVYSEGVNDKYRSKLKTTGLQINEVSK